MIPRNEQYSKVRLKIPSMGKSLLTPVEIFLQEDAEEKRNWRG